MRNSSVANATSVTPSGRVIAGAWSIVRLVGTAARLPSGGHGCGGAAVPNWASQLGGMIEADLLTRWAFNQMLIGVATRKYARSVRLPDGDLAGQAKRATTKSSVSRRFVALSTAKLKEWLAADLSGLDLLVIQIDGLRVGDHVLVAAIGIDGAGDKHVLAVAEGATENAAVVKVLLSDLVERGLRPDIVRLFIVDGAKALSRAVRDTFGNFALIQRCQVHKGRNIVERLDPSLHAGVVKKVLRQAWGSPTAEQAERVLRNCVRPIMMLLASRLRSSKGWTKCSP